MKNREISINFVETTGACEDFYWPLAFVSLAMH